jgi:hypothetical protein
LTFIIRKSVLLVMDGFIFLTLQTDKHRQNKTQDPDNLSEISSKLQLPTGFAFSGISVRWVKCFTIIFSHIHG